MANWPNQLNLYLTIRDCATHTAELFRPMFPENAESMVFFDIFIGIIKVNHDVSMDTKVTNGGFCIQEKIEEASGNADEYNARMFLMA